MMKWAAIILILIPEFAFADAIGNAIVSAVVSHMEQKSSAPADDDDD